MTIYADPSLWAVPEWHADFGDTVSELEHLRILAQYVQGQFPQLEIGLEIPEPGLMYVIVNREKECIAEVYSIATVASNGSRRYGVFVSPNASTEQDFYCESPGEVVSKILASD